MTLVVVLTLVGAHGCSKPSDSEVSEHRSLEQELANLLYGSGQACESDEACNGSVCYEGGCIGVLLAPEPWLQRSVAAQVAERLHRDIELKTVMLSALRSVLLKPQANASEKARTIPILEELNALPLLELLAQDESAPLASQASLALCRKGRAPQAEFCTALTESDDAAVAVQALDAIARSGFPNALPVLLSTLNPDLDRMIIRSGLQAIETLNDQRAIRPLVLFLEEAPDYLRLNTVRTLRKIAKSRIGQSPAAWKRWIDTNNPPAPPAYTLRRVNSTKVLGIPEP